MCCVLKQANSCLFQFLYGAIKGLGVAGVGTQGNLFQFLYGAIKGKHKGGKAVIKVEFQFLYGAIKGAALHNNQLGIGNFNSCMVRLKALGL
ncbi:hypothetical protein SAMN05421747_1228 [Parapedobacter composti]|uniref:Uncharacterized protein n=1 Tax=Parapedobacter composti TaxID=623281 RepID=A0A1I1LL63_9SPHI|nr:hypothetical protein SAMN05421747_1228 [Parapedobacter composti]